MHMRQSKTSHSLIYSHYNYWTHVNITLNGLIAMLTFYRQKSCRVFAHSFLSWLTFHKHFSLRNYIKHVWIIPLYGIMQFL
jgi:hypothetical protein